VYWYKTLELVVEKMPDDPADPCFVIAPRLFSKVTIPEQECSWVGHLLLAGAAAGDLFFGWPLASDGTTRPGHCLAEHGSPESKRGETMNENLN
jgi:hypothetical protein